MMNNKNSEVYLSYTESLCLKGIGILSILFNNFFHLIPPVNFWNEHIFRQENFTKFIDAFTLTESINCIFSFFGFYAVFLFVFLSGYGLTKSFIKNEEKKPCLFVLKHIAKIYFLLLLGIAIYCILYHPKLDKSFFYLLSLTQTHIKYPFLYAGPWWFFSLIAQLYLLFIPLFYLLKNDKINFLYIFCCYLLIALYWQHHWTYDRALWSNSFGHIPEFALGILTCIYGDKFDFIKKQSTNYFIFIISLIIILLSQIYSYVFVLSFIAGATFFISLFYILKRRTSKFLILIGKISPYLFTLHGFTFRKNFVYLAFYSQNAFMKILYAICYVSINIVIALCIYLILRKIHNITSTTSKS